MARFSIAASCNANASSSRYACETIPTNSPCAALHRFGNPLDLTPDAEQVAAPEFRDLLLGVAAPHQLESDVERFGGAITAVDAANAVEVRRHPDVTDDYKLH